MCDALGLPLDRTLGDLECSSWLVDPTHGSSVTLSAGLLSSVFLCCVPVLPPRRWRL